MGRFSLSSTSPEHEEAEDWLEPYEPQDNIVEPCAPSLNPIYVYYHPQQPKQKRISIWWWIVAVVVIAHIVARYGPPAPPPHSHETISSSWHDFFRKEGTKLVQSLTTLGSVIPHVWHWCVQGIRQEVEYLYDEWTRAPPCPIVMNNDKQQHWNIVGQPRAVTIVSDALDGWDQESSLFILLTGTVGVGKRELAKQVATYVFNDCGDAILELDGQDNDDLFTTLILRHVQRQEGHGAVVTMRHLEDVSSRALMALLQMLQQHNRVVFVGITGIGTRTIHHNLKKHGNMNQIHQVEMEMAIRDEVDDYFREDVAKYFHAIAPFLPIGQVELQTILQLKVERIGQEQAGKQWKCLVMTDELAATLVGPSFVEYIEWKNKNTGETILVFSGTGAEILETSSPIMNKVTAQIKRCLATATPELVGKLDYDQGTSQGLVSWCAGNSCYESCRFSLD